MATLAELREQQMELRTQLNALYEEAEPHHAVLASPENGDAMRTEALRCLQRISADQAPLRARLSKLQATMQILRQNTE